MSLRHLSPGRLGDSASATRADHGVGQPRRRWEQYSAPARKSRRSEVVTCPSTPLALWRLIEIGERAGLVQSEHRPNLVKAFVGEGAIPPAVVRVLHAFGIDATSLFVMTALFAAGDRSLDIAALQGETLASRTRLSRCVAELARKGILTCDPVCRGRFAIVLTPAGRQTTVLAIYRVIEAAKSGW